MELDSKLQEEIERLCKEGDDYFESDDLERSEAKFLEALELVPDPNTDWESSTWILAALADVYFSIGQYKSAQEILLDVMNCPGAIGNPFLHLRLGQVQLELDNNDQAADELTRAYMGAGEEIFEDDDGKYFNFLKTKIIID